MLDPVTNRIASQQAAQAAAARRVQDARRAGPRPTGRADEPDSFDAALDRAESVDRVRPLADADQEEAREDREQGAAPGYAPRVPPPSGEMLDLSA